MSAQDNRGEWVQFQKLKVANDGERLQSLRQHRKPRRQGMDWTDDVACVEELADVERGNHEHATVAVFCDIMAYGYAVWSEKNFEVYSTAEAACDDAAAVPCGVSLDPSNGRRLPDGTFILYADYINVTFPRATGAGAAGVGVRREAV